MFRDYYESDLEEYPDNENLSDLKDESLLRNSGDFDLRFIELVEPQVNYTDRKPVEDFLDKSIFKYKYRKVADPKYESRNERVIQRFIHRAAQRDPRINQELFARLENLYARNDNVSNVLDLLRTSAKNSPNLYDDLMPFARYISEEGLQQYRDYYETDEEEGINSERNTLIQDLSERDKLKFVECYDNPLNKSVELDQYYVTIPKRPYDNRQSIVSNFVQDLLDFNSRVRPIQRTLAWSTS
jgi:hypothetical protein